MEAEPSQSVVTTIKTIKKYRYSNSRHRETARFHISITFMDQSVSLNREIIIKESGDNKRHHSVKQNS